MALVTRVSKFAMLTVCNVASNAEHHEHLLQQCEGLIGALPGLFDAGTVKLVLLASTVDVPHLGLMSCRSLCRHIYRGSRIQAYLDHLPRKPSLKP